VERVFLFDILSLGGELSFDAGLRAVMESSKLQKVCVVAFVVSSDACVKSVKPQNNLEPSLPFHL